MSKQHLINVRLNYFGAFIKESDIADLLTKGNFKNENYLPTISNLLGLPQEAITPEILKRYIKVTPRKVFMNVVPENAIVFARILKPLRSSLKAYCLEEYESCIALNGVICEMLAILIYLMYPFKLNGNSLSAEQELKIYGDKFNKITQKRRLDILVALGAIDDTTYADLTFVRKERNEQLHVWALPKQNLKHIAAKTHIIAMGIFKQVCNLKFEKGRGIISEAFGEFLSRPDFEDDKVQHNQ